MNSIYSNGKQYYINQDNCKNNDDIDCTLEPVQCNSALVLPVPVALTNSSVCSRLNKFIVSVWGVNIHPDDDKLILFTRRNFSIRIKNHFSRIFSNMLKDRVVLSNGEVLKNCFWSLVANELLPVATKSSEPIIEEYSKELDRVLPRVRVIDINEDDNCSVTRKLTDHEKDSIMARAMNFTHRRISYIARISWKSITKIKGTASNVYNKTYAGVNTGGTNGSLKIRLRYIDEVSILNVRKKFSSNIKAKIHGKFSEMIENKYKLCDGTVIGRFAWSRVSKELFPIAQEEARPVIDDEIKELEVIISKSRVVVDSEVVRKITNEEKRVVLESTIGFVYSALRNMCTRVWENLVDSLRSNISDARDSVVVADNSLSSIDGFKISLYYEDDCALLKIRRKFSHDIKRYISSKFREMIDDGYKFDDGSTLCMCPWVKVSKKMIPIIMEKIKPIIGSERTEINRTLLKSRAVFSKSDGVNVTKKLTSKDRSTIVEEIIKYSYSHVVNNISRWWKEVVISLEERFSESCDSSLGIELNRFVANIRGVNIHPDDNMIILRVRKKFSVKIECHLRKLFTDTIRGKSILPIAKDNDTVIGKLDWTSVSKELFPIVKRETNHIIENETKELEEVISKSRSRVLVDFGVYRELTDQEKIVSLKTVMDLVHTSLRNLCRKVWSDLISSSRVMVDCSDVGDHVVANDSQEKISSSSANVVDPMSLDSGDKCDILKFICYEDDRAICRVKRNISSDINRCIFSMFSNLLEDKYKFSDGTVIGMCSWKSVSKRILPIAKEEISTILEKERIKINGILLKSRVDVSPPGSSATIRMTRLIKSEERFTIMNDIIRSIFERVVYNLGRLWNRVVHSFECRSRELSNGCELNSTATSGITKLENICVLSASSVDLKETDKAELDNIRLEFIGSLDSIIAEVVSSLSLNFDTSFNVDDVILSVAKRSDNFFREEGFFYRVESLLSGAKVTSSSGCDRAITYKESNDIFQTFMDNICSDRDYLVRKRIGKLRPPVVPIADALSFAS